MDEKIKQLLDQIIVEYYAETKDMKKSFRLMERLEYDLIMFGVELNEKVKNERN